MTAIERPTDPISNWRASLEQHLAPIRGPLLDRDCAQHHLSTWWKTDRHKDPIMLIRASSGMGKTSLVLQWSINEAKTPVIYVNANNLSALSQLWPKLADALGLVIPTLFDASSLQNAIQYTCREHQPLIILDDISSFPEDLLIEALRTTIPMTSCLLTTCNLEQKAQSITLQPLKAAIAIEFLEQTTQHTIAKSPRLHITPRELRWVLTRTKWVHPSKALAQLSKQTSYLDVIVDVWHQLDASSQLFLSQLSVFANGMPSLWLSELFDAHMPEWPDILLQLIEKGLVFEHQIDGTQWLSTSTEMRTYAFERGSAHLTSRVGDLIVNHLEQWIQVFSRRNDDILFSILLNMRHAFEMLLSSEDAHTRAACCALLISSKPYHNVPFEFESHLEQLTHLRDKFQAHIQLALANLYTEISDLGSAEKTWRAMQRWLPEEPWAIPFATKAHLGLSLIALYREDVNDASKQLALAIDTCPTNHLPLQALCVAQQSRVAQIRGDRTLAKQWMEKALLLARRTNNVLLEIKMLHNLGVFHTDVNALNEAMLYLKQCQAQRDSCPISLRANCDNAMGMVWMRLGEHKEASWCFERSSTTFERCASFFGVLMAKGNLAMVAMDALELDKAQNYLEEAYLLAAGQEDLYIVLALANIHCCLHLLRGENEHALALYQQRIAPSLAQIQLLDLCLCLNSLRVFIGCRLQRWDDVHDALQTLDALSCPSTGHHQQMIELIHIFADWHTGVHDAISDTKQYKNHCWQWLLRVNTFTFADLGHSEALRWITNLICADLPPHMQTIWLALCANNHLDHWWINGPCDWIRRPDHTWLDLQSAEQLKSILSVIRDVANSGGVDIYTMIDAVWPDEYIEPDAAANRLYVSISKMRKRGIGIIVNHSGQYMIDPTQSVLWLT